MSNCKKVLEVKQGTMFSVNGKYHDTDDNPIPLTGLDPKCEIWFRGSMIAKLDTMKTNAVQGEFVIYADPMITENWPVGDLLCDIVYVPTQSWNSSIVATETFTIRVLPRITRNY